MPLLASIQNFFFDWYPVFGVAFSAGILTVFVLLLRSTMGTTRPESVKASSTGTVRWEDVQGVDAAKEELIDVAEWLKDPKRFETLGARAPRGVLLYGPPGTGKTMLARAVAAHAGVDFFAASGSSFVEMFVGRGAARIRRLFREARKSGRAVVFIDEIDAVGGHRGSGSGDGGTSEREQALNQLLVELDGFERDPGTVIVLAASNAGEDLDEALLRQSVGSQQARRLTEKERRIVAYHEAGHALCRRLCGLDPPEILSIVPRGPALGFVAHSPSEDRYLRSRKDLMDEIVILLGGRAAEEEVFDEAYSGAADDLSRVQKICVQMVTEFGMTVSHGPPDSAPLAQPTGDYSMSDHSRREVDENAQELAHMAYARARQLMQVNRRCLDDLASNALERETLTREDLDDIFDAHDLRRTLLPKDKESEARRVIARDRSRSTGALMPQHTQPDEHDQQD